MPQCPRGARLNLGTPHKTRSSLAYCGKMDAAASDLAMIDFPNVEAARPTLQAASLTSSASQRAADVFPLLDLPRELRDQVSLSSLDALYFYYPPWIFLLGQVILASRPKNHNPSQHPITLNSSRSTTMSSQSPTSAATAPSASNGAI